MRLLLPMILITAACDRDAQYEIESFASSVSTTWADCDPTVVPRLATELQVQFIESFEACHSNNFTLSTWAPDGVHLYFQLAFSAFVLNGETKELWPLPITEGMPADNAAWISARQMAVPLNGEDGISLVLFNLPGEDQPAITIQKTIQTDFEEPKDAQSIEGGKVLLVSGTQDGTRKLFSINLETGKSTQAFSWLDKSFDRFSYHEGEDLLFLGIGTNVTALKGITGTPTQTFENATRATMHPLGTLIALEATGNPISTYTPNYTGELTETMQRREAARKAKWLEDKPDWIPNAITPPAIDFWDVENERRVRFFQIHGDGFQWYPGNPYYLSFRLWGLGDQQLNPNILLSDLPARLKVLEATDELDPGMLLVKAKKPAP
jgi:hypothetical protein